MNKMPHALLEMMIQPQSSSDEVSLMSALHLLVERDSELSFKVLRESGELILGGISELQLDCVVERLRREHGITVLMAAPQVAYRETIGTSRAVDYLHRRSERGAMDIVRLSLQLTPTERGSGAAFVTRLVSGTLSPECISAIEDAVKASFDEGPLIGMPMTDLTVSLCDVDTHNTDPAPAVFHAATLRAMAEGYENLRLLLLEPIMAVNIECPVDSTEDVIGDIDARRGQIYDQAINGDMTQVRAFVPLAQMFGYQNELQKLTAGAGRFGMTYSHYAEVPPNRSGGPDDFPPAVGMRA